MDEGVGVHAVRALEERYSFSEGVEFLDGGTMGLDLLPYVEGCERLLILDAVEMDAPPGTIKVVEGDAISAVLGMKLTVHQIALPDLLFAARLSGVAPSESALVGVQPETIDDGAASKMARDIVKKIEETLVYPGQIKVTVIRESRSVEYAR